MENAEPAADKPTPPLPPTPIPGQSPGAAKPPAAPRRSLLLTPVTKPAAPTPAPHAAPQLSDLPGLTTLNYKCQPVRWLMREGEPWWVAIDILRLLGLKNTSQALSRLEPGERDTLTSSEGIVRDERAQTICVVNEPGVYRLVLRCRKRGALAFQHWLLHDVLPAIRKTGVYRMKPPSFHEAARELLARADDEIRLLEQRCQHNAQAVEVYHRLHAMGAAFDSKAMARYLDLPGWDGSRVLRYLMEHGVVKADRWDGGLLDVTPYYREEHLFDIQAVEVGNYGSRRPYHKVVATLRGLLWLRDNLRGDARQQLAALPTMAAP